MVGSARLRIYDAAIRLFAEHGERQINVVQLARLAGMARGTIYNNIEDLDGLFDAVAAHLAAEMRAELDAALAGIDDPFDRLASGVRLYVERAAADPDWGRFVARFGLSERALHEIWSGRPGADLAAKAGVVPSAESGPALVPHLVSGLVIGVITAMLDGRVTAAEACDTVIAWIFAGLGRERSATA